MTICFVLNGKQWFCGANLSLQYQSDELGDDIYVVKHELKISLGVNSYDEFVEKIKDSEREFRKGF